MGAYFETYPGVVLDNADPVDQHRLLIQVPAVLGEQSEWAMPEEPSAALPEIGAEISVRFEAGDETHPIWSPDAANTTGPDAAAASGGYAGTYRGLALDSTDPGRYGRVLVAVPEVLGEQSMWAMPEHPDAALPAVGDEIWVRFEHGDVEYPTWTGGSGTGGAGADGAGTGATPAATFTDTYRGVVLDNVDPGGYGRVLVQVPAIWVGESVWAMPEDPGRQSPGVGAEIAVRFENGDPNHPTWSS